MGQRGAIYVGGPPCKDFLVGDSGIGWRYVADLQRLIERVKYQPLSKPLAVSHQDVVEAAQRIAGLVERTPLVESEIDGVRIHLKCECLQTGGAFKLRGATNRLLQLSPEARTRGVVAFSSGNHARGVAIAARRLGIPAVIVMPADAPRVKIEGTRSEGAEIIFYDRRSESREGIAAKISEETGAAVVPSFDDPMIVAGQGSVGLEIVDQLGRSPPRIVIPCGGGGLASGIALAVRMPRSRSSSQRVGTTWPVRSSLAKLSPCQLMRRHRVRRPADTTRIADHVRYPARSLRGGLVRKRSGGRRCGALRMGSPFARRRAGRRGWLAALLAGKLAPIEDVVVVLSGGNVDPALHARIIANA